MRVRILEPRHQHIAVKIDLPVKAFIRSTCRTDIDDAVPVNPYFFVGETDIRGKAQCFSVVEANHFNLLL